MLEEGTGKEIVFRIFRSPWVGMSVDQLDPLESKSGSFFSGKYSVECSYT